MGIIIRAGTRHDCGAILQLVQALAVHDDMPEAAKLQAKDLVNDGFGDHRFYKCLVAVDPAVNLGHSTTECVDDSSNRGDENEGLNMDPQQRPFAASANISAFPSVESSNDDGFSVARGRRSIYQGIVGYVLYFYIFSWKGKAVYMEDFYVTSAYRKQGVGTRLWKSMLQEALSAGAVQCRFCTLKTNTSSRAYYAARGVTNLTATNGYHTFRMNRAAMEKFASAGTPDNKAISIANATTTTSTTTTLNTTNGTRNTNKITNGHNNGTTTNGTITTGTTTIGIASTDTATNGTTTTTGQPASSSVSVRGACPADLPEVLAMLRALTEWLTGPLEEDLQPDTLSEAIFGKEPLCQVVVALDSLTDAVIGVALYYFTYSSWEGRSVYLKDVYIKPEHRSRGAGTKLCRTIIQRALADNCTRCDFATQANSTEELPDFTKLGAEDITTSHGWQNLLLEKSGMQKLSTS